MSQEKPSAPEGESLLETLEKLRELQKPTISQEEAEKCQKWAQLDGATAFHLIERHAANWADTRLMMEAWLNAKSAVSEIEAKQDAERMAAGFGEALALTEEAVGGTPPNRDVIVPREIYEGALNYIRHVGANHVMRGDPRPQQWIVDGLERAGERDASK